MVDQKTNDFFYALVNNAYLYGMLRKVEKRIQDLHNDTEQLFGTDFLNAFPKNSKGGLFTDEDFIESQLELDIADGVEGAQELKDFVAGDYAQVAKSFFSYRSCSKIFDTKLLTPRVMATLTEKHELDKYGITRDGILRCIDTLLEASYSEIKCCEREYALEVLEALSVSWYEDDIRVAKYCDDDGDVILYVDESETITDHACRYAVLLTLADKVAGAKPFTPEFICASLLEKKRLPND